MSNLPPVPPTPPYGAQPTPPYGAPPTGAPPTGGAPYGYPQQPKTNTWAIVSLVLGILGCVPFVTSLAAVITGFVGVGASKPPRPGMPPVGGKGMAVAGIILGLIGLVGWSAGAYGVYWGVGKVKELAVEPANVAGASFISALSRGDTRAAAEQTTGDLSQADLDKLKGQIERLGAFKEFKINAFDVKNAGADQWRVTLGGTASFDKGNQAFTSSLVGSLPSGGAPPSLKIEDFKLK